jgi:Schlafen, AlbA_2
LKREARLGCKLLPVDSDAMAQEFGAPAELLEALLEGDDFGPADLDYVIDRFAKENQHLEYKDGRITTEKTERQLKHEILFHTTAFANAVGGVLVIGVSEEKAKPRGVTGAKAPGDSTLAEWAARILTPSLGGFSPPLRILQVPHPSGNVLVIAAARAPQLVPYVEAGEIRYSLRIDDSTVPVPPYLIADLVLGRRNHPVLVAREIKVKGSLLSGGKAIFLRLVVTVENTSLPASVNTTIAIVAWSRARDDVERAGDTVRLHVGATPPEECEAEFPGERWVLRHLPSEQADATIRAYEQLHATIKEGIRVPRSVGGTRFGLYIMPRLSPPIWYEVTCRYSVQHDRGESKVDTDIEFKRAERPRVEWGMPLTPDRPAG